MISRISLVLLFLFFGITSVAAQTTDIVTLEITQKTRIHIGESGEIEIGITIKEDHHVQANPASDEFLIPLTVKIKPLKDILLGAPIYPPGKAFTLKGASNALSVYDGRFSVRIPIKILPAAQPKEHELEGELHYQVCNSVRCFAPRSMSFTIPIKTVIK